MKEERITKNDVDLHEVYTRVAHEKSWPNYKIGDIVVYPDRYWKKEDDGDSTLCIYQSKIVEAVGYIDTEDKNDRVAWFYMTEHIVEEQEDALAYEDILYKL